MICMALFAALDLYAAPKITAAPAKVREALKLCVREFGLKGVGQSSWGPTGFAFAESDDKATALIDALNGAFNEAGTLTFRECEPCNRGAIVSGTVEQRPGQGPVPRGHFVP